jgi:DNA-binding SARP family transcriptional activator
MLFGALGPLFVRDDAGRDVELGSPLQRTLLGMLVARRREVVTMDQIVDGLWPGGGPVAATASIQAYVSNLRRALEPDRSKRRSSEVIVSGGGGYHLACADVDTDVGRFEALVVSSIQAIDGGRPDDAIDMLDHAASLWRDEPYPELGELETAVFERARLHELRRAAQEQRTAALMLTGRDLEAAVELEVLVREQPLRERRWEMYITALYRTGRQADALRAYTRARTTLIDQLGIEPGADLRALEQRVIDQDPSLLAPSTQAEIGVEPRADAPLVGREAPMARLRAAGSACDGGVLRVSLVSGEAGIGKSALVEAYTGEVVD